MSPEIECLPVSQKTKQKADQCTRTFACLSGRSCATAPVEDCWGEGAREVLVVGCSATESCSYKTNLGYSGAICACPVRKELFHRYSI